MATQMLVPLLLLGGATVALAAASSKKKNTVPPGTVRTYTLDTTLPSTVRDQVLAALATEQDPTKLDAFASAIAPTYPLSAAALREKASMLRAGTLPKNPVDLLTQVPDPPRTQVMQQLMMQNDPNALEAYAQQLEAQYPAAAAALRMKEAVLRGQAPEVAPPTSGNSLPTPPAVAANVPAAPAPAAPSVPLPPPIQPTPTPTPTAIPTMPSFPSLPTLPSLPSLVPPAATVTPNAPPAPTSNPVPAPAAPPFLPGLDANMPPEMQKAVAGALTTESDSAKLEGFASAIQAQYPIASGLLKAKAEALRLMSGVPSLPSMPLPSAPIPATSSPIVAPPAPVAPVATGGTYTVLSGDFPIKIAQKLTGNGNRWHELIAANPNKKTAPDGNFATLLPGEVLKLPASWSSASPAAPAPVAVAPASTVPTSLPSVASVLNALPAAVQSVPGLSNLPALPPAPSLPALIPAAVTSSSATYKVVSGDNPSKIALKLTGNSNRWKELIAANPQKKTGADGNFTSLLPNEILHLPASWSSGAANAAHA